MTARNKTARIAGLTYLLLILSGMLSLVYIPSQLIVRESAAQTFANITSSEFLFRLGIVSSIITFLIFMVLPLTLHKLLHEVNATHAKLMVIFALVSIPISFANILNEFTVLTLITKPEFLQQMSKDELQTLVMLQLEKYRNGVNVSQIFWGLWLLPFGYLVYKSDFLPKLFGVFLMLGCFGYLITFFGGFLYPNFHQTPFANIVGFPAPIGEIGICLWLLIMGTNKLKINKKLYPKSGS